MKYVLTICGLMCSVICSGPLFAQTDVWEQTNGLVGGNIQKLIVDPQDYLYAVRQDSGVYRSTDDGANWIAVNTGITDLDIRALILNDDGSLYAGGDGVFRTTDEGNHWTGVSSGLTSFVHDLAAGANGNLVAATDGGVYRSTNNGGSWTNIGFQDTVIWNVAVNNAGDLFAGLYEDAGGVFRSTDNGGSWVAVNSGLIDPYSRDLICRPNGDIYFIDNVNGGLFRSGTNGDSWDLLDTQEIMGFAASLAFNSHGDMFVGSAGVFRSTDNGSHWTRLGSLTDQVVSLAVNSAGILFAGTYADGVLRTIGTTVNVARTEGQLPSAFALQQNYPNPFNPTTTIEYDLPKHSFVTLVVYDVQGREVRELVDEDESAGRHEIKFDATNLSSGEYFYRLHTNEFDQTKKLLLVR
jgi:Secretion system C-terminal sorting domain